MTELISVWVKEPHKPAELVKIANVLENMQTIVGGYIETVKFATNGILVCNEEGIRLGLDYN